ncbi:cytochrome P450 [Stereum hirsutum FP-91666 SS1]|uniref:cytochrome P450 n=1 Tax=Stereum hirsutum (strain FP-91666) TaxID=721885 RepID=UPI0004449602|nr:cytochrome P450 [Stereum hirsutum FP-91666 SS1]EIM85782.1 cytochrome P450 [Stereum hirsutum FP-91666 SS1]
MSFLQSFSVVDAAACALFVLVLTLVHVTRSSSKFPLPPGPKRLPLIGNLLQFPNHDHGERLAPLRKEHGRALSVPICCCKYLNSAIWFSGDILSLRIMGQNIIILSSLHVAKELLQKRARNWSDRPVIPLLHLMQLSTWNTIFVSDTDAHRAQRRIADQHFRPSALSPYRSMMRWRVNELLRSFLTSIIMSTAYGYKVENEDDGYITKLEAFNKTLGDSMSPTSSIINVFPILGRLPGWVPGFGKLRDVEQVKREGEEIRNEPFDFVKKSVLDGSAEPSLSRSYFTAEYNLESPSDKDEDHTKNIAASLYGAGSDTTSVVMTNFMLVLLLYPKVQQRAQKELDSVIGRERLPNNEDRGRLPYIEAMCKEILRWRLVTQLGVAHSTREDDIFEGYFIPKGIRSFYLGENSWAMLHDPVKYPDPESFQPERFLTPTGEFKDDPDIAAAFGFGRRRVSCHDFVTRVVLNHKHSRVCPGRHLVDEIAYMFFSTFLSVFTVEKQKDEKGNEIPVNDKHNVEFSLSHPPLFQCSIFPRDDAALRLIQSTEDEQTN